MPNSNKDTIKARLVILSFESSMRKIFIAVSG